MSYYRNQLEEWLKHITVNADRVLDLGGASNPVRKRVKEYIAGETCFLDNGAEEAKVDYIPFDINKPLTEQLKGFESYMSDDFHEERPFEFDTVFCLEVFEYVYAPWQAIQNIWNLMSGDSICYISFPTIYPIHEPHQIDYLRYNLPVIKKYFSMFPFQQLEITPRVATFGRHDLARFYADEKMHPLKHSSLPFDIGYLVKARKITV